MYAVPARRMSHTAELLLSYINLMFLFIAVASDTQVFIVALELLLRWLSLTEGGDRKNEHADSSQSSLF